MVAGMDGFAKEESRLRARIESGVLIWMGSSLGVYISVPFCRAKCTYCNFASGVFGAGPSGSARMDRYVEQVCAEMRGARVAAERIGADLPGLVDTVFFGGGTPSLLSAEQMRRLFETLRGEFEVAAGAEVTLECAPGQIWVWLVRNGLSAVSRSAEFPEAVVCGLHRVRILGTTQSPNPLPSCCLAQSCLVLPASSGGVVAKHSSSLRLFSFPGGRLGLA